MKSLSKKRLGKKEREEKVLFGLIDQYIDTFQSIGSKTLMETSFQDLSSATIRNYFASLESQGYLSQQHASGGRIPTEQGFMLYAKEFLKDVALDGSVNQKLKALSQIKSKEVGAYLQNAAELLSELTSMPTFISSPRFDNDFISGLKLVMVDESRCLCVVVTELGLIQTEVIYLEEKLHLHALKRIEDVLLNRIKSQGKESDLNSAEEKVAQKIYNEVMVRYIIGYANFSLEDIYKTGLSQLLSYPEFNNAESFASGLALFENEEHLRKLLQSSLVDKNLKYYIGSELTKVSPITKDCSALVLPYSIGGKTVGAIGLVGPIRMPYKNLFGTLRAFSESITENLTQSLAKYKLTYRTPADGTLHLESKNSSLIEDQRKDNNER